MKPVVSILVISFSLGSVAAEQSPKPFKTIDLNKVKITGSDCQVKLQDGLSSIIWLDEQHLVASSFAARCPSAPPSSPTATEIAVLDDAGPVLSTARRSDLIYLSRGPRGTIAGLSSGKIDLLNTQLLAAQTLDCPNSLKSCGITIAPSSTFDSEFAVCSAAADTQQICDFYRGWPTAKVSSRELLPNEDPYTNLATSGLHKSWQVAPGEVWFFNTGRLTRSNANNVSSLVNSEDFVGKEGGGCDGHLSDDSPRRFMAVCIGSHWYSDGMFDSIFGFSRVIVFDVSTGSIVKRIDGPAFISAAMSPSGKKVAILKDSKIRIYAVD